MSAVENLRREMVSLIRNLEAAPSLTPPMQHLLDNLRKAVAAYDAHTEPRCRKEQSQ